MERVYNDVTGLPLGLAFDLYEVSFESGQVDAVTATPVNVRHPASPGRAVVLRIEPLMASRPFGIHR